MSKINTDDERNILYWARRYGNRDVSIEDLQQEGRLAVLQAEQDSHKYYKMWIAIHRYAEKNKRETRRRGPRNARTDQLEQAVVDQGLSLFEKQDTLDQIIQHAGLSHEETIILYSIYGDSEKKQDIAQALGISRPTLNKYLKHGLAKCARAAQTLGEEDV